MKTLAVFALSTILALAAFAGDKKPERKKDLSFDNAVVEGLNAPNLDLLESTGKNDGRKQAHLYKKREHYHPELKVRTREMEYQQ